MSWILYTILTVIFFSISNVFDKIFISKKYKNIYSFAVVINIIYLIFFSIVGYFIKDTFIFNQGLYWTVAAALCYFGMWICWWKGLTTGEVSRVIAIFFTSPIFNALLAIIFLKETLSPLKWLAIFSIVAGAVLSTYEEKKSKLGFNKAYIFALFAAIFASVGNVLSKQAMVYWTPMTVQVVGYLATLPLFLLFLINKQVAQETKQTFTKLKSFMLVFVRGFIGFLAIAAFQLAVGAGPVSLVVALNGTQPMMIFIISTLISFFAPKIIKEELTKRALFTKSAAIVLIVTGAIIISLF